MRVASRKDRQTHKVGLGDELVNRIQPNRDQNGVTGHLPLCARDRIKMLVHLCNDDFLNVL